VKIGIDTSKIDISMKQNRMTVLVVFADKNRANWYMENCFEYYTRVLVTSMDGIFPKHPELKTDVKKLWRDNNANLIVFGTHCIEDNPPAGNVFSFDKWAIEYARRRSNVVQRSVANLDWADDPISIARMVEVFANSRNNRNNIPLNMYSVKETNYDWDRLPKTLKRLIR
jgi:hypothetical protein